MNNQTIGEKIQVKTWQNARAIIKQGLEEDEGLMIGFLANIACLLQDRYHMSHALSNCAAEHIVRLVFLDTYHKSDSSLTEKDKQVIEKMSKYFLPSE